MIFAHDIGPAPDLPAPVEFYIIAAGLALVAIFVTLTVRRHEPAYETAPDYSRALALRAPVGLLSALGLIGLLLVIGQLIRMFGSVVIDESRPTIAPVLVWVVFWLVVPFASVVVGNWYSQLNPWRTLARVLGVGESERPTVVSTIGVWPAAVALVALTWFQRISANPTDPTIIAVAATIYTVYVLGAIAAVGREAGLTSFDLFTPYNRLISSIAPVGRDGGGWLVWRGWLRALPAVPRWPGLWVFVVVMVGSLFYDGLTATDWFFVADSVIGETAMLVGTLLLLAIVYRLAAPSAQRYAHTLVPFAVAFAFAHYFTLIVFEGQLLVAAVSDPFGLGWDLFGTADQSIRFFAIPAAVVWYIQLTSIVIGSATGVVLVHDRAIADFGTDAIRAQYAMLALMIGLTTVGLLVLAG